MKNLTENSNSKFGAPVVIVGAGLAGLACARLLVGKGVPVLVLETESGPGGRIRTDTADGYLFDRGFQVFLTAYPEAQELLDYSALNLKSFYPGAFIRRGGKFLRMSDPWRRPLAGVVDLVSGGVSIPEAMAIWKIRRSVLEGSVKDLFSRPECATSEYLRGRGVPDRLIVSFFRPFFGGVFLDLQLLTSSRMFEFVFRMMASGDVVIPARGMEQIPLQLAAALGKVLRLGVEVARVEPSRVILGSGETIAASAVVLATGGTQIEGAPPPDRELHFRSVTCLYFSSPLGGPKKPAIMLNGDGAGPINNLVCLTRVSPEYSPAGRFLYSVTVLDPEAQESPTLVEEVRRQLVAWIGGQESGWDHLRTYRITRALPDQTAPALSVPQRPVQLPGGFFACGDHLDNASINGAMESGRRAAEALLKTVRQRGS